MLSKTFPKPTPLRTRTKIVLKKSKTMNKKQQKTHEKQRWVQEKRLNGFK
jgi:putative alpha-1,2-mannosidase